MVIRDGATIKIPETSLYRKRISVDVVKSDAAPHALALPGVIEADPAMTVNVLPVLTGRLIELPVRLDEQVKAGQVLARIQSTDLLQAGADAAKARDAHELAVKARDRALEVFKAGGNAQKDVEAAESAVVQAKSELDRAVSRLHVYGVKEEKDPSKLSVPVHAPISGIVTALNVGSGAIVNDPTAALLTLSNVDHLFLTAQVPENAISKIHVGQKITATVPAFPGRVISATVNNISANLDADTRRTRVRAVIQNPNGTLRPNMYASIAFNIDQPAQVVVPTSALVMRNEKVMVFVESQPWTFEAREVVLGVEEGSKVRVRSGIKSGERIVVRGGVLLND
jgi:cobalt-zinc-cadmium efflux system membrane fusion protein